MDRWKRFIAWCQEPSKIKIRSFNPKNIMLVELSVLLISLITSGTWLFQAVSVSPPATHTIFASISGDGTKIAYTSYMSGSSEVFVVNSDGTGLTQLTNNQALNMHASISDDGTKVAFHSNMDGDNEIYIVNSDGTGLTQLTNNTVGDQYASISSDGTKVAFTSYPTDGGNVEVFVVNSDGTGLTQLTSWPAVDRNPCISGDGTKVAFHSWTGGDTSIFVVNSDGTGLTTVANKEGCFCTYASISDNGTKVAFMFCPPLIGSLYSYEDNEIFVVNSDGTGLTQLTNNTAEDSYACISGDGTKVAFQSDVDGDDEIFIINSDGTGLTQLTDNTVDDQYASISSDGTKVAYTSDAAGDNEIHVIAYNPNITPPSEAGFNFPLEYAAGIVAVTVAVASAVIFLVRKKLIQKGVNHR